MIRKEILSSINASQKQGDKHQANLAEDLLSRLTFLEDTKGFKDRKTSEDKYMELARKISKVGSKLPDDIAISELYNYQSSDILEWKELVLSLNKNEKYSLRSSLISAFKYQRRIRNPLKLKDLREMDTELFLALGNIGKTRANFLSEAFKKEE